MSTVKKILGKKGRITIPYEFRQILDMNPDDVLTFSMNEDRSCVVITKAKLRHEPAATTDSDDISLEDYLKSQSTKTLISAHDAITYELIRREVTNED